jgi:SAM-dependent methyltransferase
MSQKKQKTKVPSPKGPFRLNLGCGTDIRDGFINIDLIDAADLQFDLDKVSEKRMPYPDNSVELTLCSHILEHLHNFPDLMNELHRVTKPGGVLTVMVPMYPSKQAFQDPTHVRFFTDETFSYFNRDHFLFQEHGVNYGFKPWKVQRQVVQNGWELIVNLIKP